MTDYQAAALADYLKHATREFAIGYADGMMTEYRGKSEAYEAGFYAAYHAVESHSYTEGEYLSYE